MYEFESTEHFQEYFFKVYSSSIHTAAEQIIVLYGLYALLLECASVLTNPEQKAAHKAQAQVCRDGLESVIAGLSFHLPSNYDYTLALSLAVSRTFGPCVEVTHQRRHNGLIRTRRDIALSE
jgi:hypothetical protein